MRPKVLIVEDERAVAEAVAYALATDGCHPLCAETGAEARRALPFVREVALLHGGDASLENLPAGGARAELRIRFARGAG